MPDSVFHELEAKALLYREQNNLWGEVKWQNITSAYLECYIGFLDIYLKDQRVSFHTWAYRELGGHQRLMKYGTDSTQEIFYRQCYALIRSTMHSCFKEDGSMSFRVLADSTGEASALEYNRTR